MKLKRLYHKNVFPILFFVFLTSFWKRIYIISKFIACVSISCSKIKITRAAGQRNNDNNEKETTVTYFLNIFSHQICVTPRALCVPLILFRIRHLHLSPQSIIISIMNTPNCFVNHFILHKWYAMVHAGNVKAKGVQRAQWRLIWIVCVYLFALPAAAEGECESRTSHLGLEQLASCKHT